MPAKTNFNSFPYYDDYDPTKKFHRILFKPGYAVQSRELTQSQSILQNQVERVSDYLFEKGAMVIPGEITFDLNYYAVKLTSKTYTDINSYVGLTLTGQTSGVVAVCINAVATDGTNPDTLYVKYNKTGTDNATITFTNGETLKATATATDGQTVSTTSLATAVVNSTATGSSANIAAGVYYINGFQVAVDDTTLILDPYTNTPSYRVGLTVTESTVNSAQDSSLFDIAQIKLDGTTVSNYNAIGADRFKIQLTLSKKSLTEQDDSNFVELLRLQNGIRQNKIGSSQYSVLEDTLARRTFDQAGDYVVKDFDLDIREQYNDGSNRGIYSFAQGGLPDYSLLTAVISPGKAYVKGYEIQTLGPSYVNIPKARDYATANNSSLNFTVGNYVNVKNVYGTPDVTFISGISEAFKRVNLFNTATAVRGTLQSTVGANVPQIGIAKTKGFELNSGISTLGVFSTSSLTSAYYKHYLFDIEMYTHLHLPTATTVVTVPASGSFTAGEAVQGQLSKAIGYVQLYSATQTATITGISVATTAVVTATAHGFLEGQQIKITGVVGMTQVNGNVYTVRNVSTNSFSLYATDGITPVNSSTYTPYASGGSATHGIIVLNNVTGTFISGETITGIGNTTNGIAASNTSASLQANAVGYLAAQKFDFSYVKQIGMVGSPPYTADCALDTYGSFNQLTGNISIANSGGNTASSPVQGYGTLFTQEVRFGDSFTFTSDAGNSITRIVSAVISDTQLTFTTAVGSSDVSTKTTGYIGRAAIQDAQDNISIFKLPYSTIATLNTQTNNSQSDTNYYIRRAYSVTLTNGTATLTTGTNEVFSSAVEKDFAVSVTSIGSSTGVSVGDVLAVTGNNYLGAQIFTLSGTPTGKSLTLNYGANYGTATIKIIATIFKSVAYQKTKTLVSNATLNLTTQTTAQQSLISLGHADIISANVYMSSDASFNTNATTNDTNITSSYTFDNGQRDNFYDIGRLTLNSGSQAPTGRILIVFNYYTHSTGDYFSVDSYPNDVTTYQNIYTYTSDTTGIVYQLRDCLDFRPRVQDASTINGSSSDRAYQATSTSLGTGASTVDVIQFNSQTHQDLEYYLPRIDKLFLDKDGTFKLVEGASSTNPPIPKGIDSAMQLYTLTLNPYTFNEKDLIIDKQDNKRYTMRDIGRLETRIANVEYYTQLSLLETQTQSLQVQDANGLDRYKNGFFVDNFTGHGVGDPTNLDYSVSMDMANGLMRPTYNSDSVNFIEKNTTDALRSANNYQKTGDLITLPYSETAVITQPYASHYENVNPFSIFTWAGSVNLSPAGDDWKETNRVPDLIINQQGSYDTMVANLGNPNLTSVELSTVWNEWQDSWIGTPTETTTTSGSYVGRNNVAANGRGAGGWTVLAQDVTTTTTQQIGQTRTGIRTAIVPQIVQTSLGDKTLSIAFIPFIRQNTISFTGTRLKPNTVVYPFFDGISVTSYVTPTGGSLAGNLVTDANGAVSGTFVIPDPKVDANPRWRTGTRIFRLTSSITNSLDDVETSAEGDYIASGSIDTVQNTIVSTRVASVVRQDVTDNQVITQTSTRTTQQVIQWIDPIAETFLVDDAGGIFATSIDIYFQSKDNNIPVTLQIREVVNGYPSRNLVPFSEVVLNPSSVNISDDASVATNFKFTSPVYLQEKTEYCFCLLSMCNNYNAWVGTIGETQVDTNRTISVNPYAGVFFKSQNGSTWTADQTTDIMFTLYRAAFTNVEGSVNFVNKDLSVKTLATNALQTTLGSNIVRVFHRNHGMHSSTDQVTIAGIPTGTYNGIASTALNGTFTNLQNITLDSYDITTTITASASGDIGGTAITATQNRQFDVANLNLQTLTVSGTEIDYSLNTVSGKSIQGSETEFVYNSTAINVHPGDNIYFTAPQMIASAVNENLQTSLIALGNSSAFLTLNLSTNNIDVDGTSKVSPVIDTTRMSMVVVQNRLNYPTSANTPNYVNDLAPYGSSSKAIYVNRPITLANPSTTLQVRLTANVRSSSIVKVYYRTTSATEVRNITNLSWIPFNTDGNEDITVTPATNATFTEYQYTASGLTQFSAFQIKIVSKGTNSSYPPVFQDLRGIAFA
jgi:hypothetical protein